MLLQALVTKEKFFTPPPVRGYQSAASPEARHALLDMNIEQETLRELSGRRATLLLELGNYRVRAPF